MFTNTKTMTRSLTEEEEKEIFNYWTNNKSLTEIQIVKYFENKYQMPITFHAIHKLYLKNIGNDRIGLTK